MAQRKRKQHRLTGKGKWKNPADSAGTDGAIEGQSPAENSTSRVSHATRAAEKAKQKQIAATKQAETTLVLTTPSIVLPAARVTRASTELAACSQAPLPPDTTSQALLTQDELARSDELCELQWQVGSCWSQVTVACFFICILTV
mgnify:CR=1 FL=1